MNDFCFYLLIDQSGERYVFFKNSKGEKLIDNFSKIPFTAESLFEDMINEFSDYPWQSEKTDDFLNEYDYDENGKLTGMSALWLSLGEERIYRASFKEAVRVILKEKTLCSQIVTSLISDEEGNLFEDMLAFMENFCKENNFAFSKDYVVEFTAEGQKSSKLNEFLSALEFVRESEKFSTAELQRYLRCAYGTVFKVIDALCILDVIEEVDGVAISGGRKYKIKE